jgi:hypothetical protein
VRRSSNVRTPYIVEMGEVLARICLRRHKRALNVRCDDLSARFCKLANALAVSFGGVVLEYGNGV